MMRLCSCDTSFPANGQGSRGRARQDNNLLVERELHGELSHAERNPGF